MKLKSILTSVAVILLVMSIFVAQASAASNNAVISGYKISDTNGNGKLDKKEPAIQGWTIYLVGAVKSDSGYGTTTRIIKRQVNTDRKGSYQFKNLPAGKYQLIEEFNSKYKPTRNFVINLNLRSNQKATNKNFFNQLVKKKKDDKKRY